MVAFLAQKTTKSRPRRCFFLPLLLLLVGLAAAAAEALSATKDSAEGWGPRTGAPQLRCSYCLTYRRHEQFALHRRPQMVYKESCGLLRWRCGLAQSQGAPKGALMALQDWGPAGTRWLLQQLGVQKPLQRLSEANTCINPKDNEGQQQRLVETPGRPQESHHHRNVLWASGSSNCRYKQQQR